MQIGTQHRSAIEARGLRPIGELARNRPHGDRLRYMAGCRCPACRGANPIVPADAARAHIHPLGARRARHIGEHCLAVLRAFIDLRLRGRDERSGNRRGEKSGSHGMPPGEMTAL